MTEQKITLDEVDPVAWTEKVELGDCRYRSDATPYLRDIITAMGDPAVKKTVIRMPSQVSFSQFLIDWEAHQAMAPSKEEAP